MEWVLGIFTVMAVMAAIVGGVTGVRLMYIDKEYKEIIASLDTGGGHVSQMHRHERSPTGSLPTNDLDPNSQRDRRMKHEEVLTDILGKREGNRRGVVVDGVCMGIILSVALATALGFSPSLLASVAIASTSFAGAMVTFYYHALNVSGEHQS